MIGSQEMSPRPSDGLGVWGQQAMTGALKICSVPIADLMHTRVHVYV